MSENKKEKYVVYENDLKFKDQRHIDPDLADWHNDSVKEDFGKDFDNVSARLKECEKSNFGYLDLSRLGLEKVPKFTAYKHYEKLKSIKYLFLNDNRLITCDERIACFENLQVLDISFNQITTIVYLPKKLKELMCHDNLLREVCPIHNYLEILDCSNNKIQILGKYDNLKQLVCTNNRITEINTYSLLKRCICKENPITKINPLYNLEHFDCSNTGISGTIEDYPSLLMLICNFTKINTIKNLPKLESFEFIGCKMKLPFIRTLKYVLCHDYENTLEISNKYKVSQEFTEGDNTCFVFVQQ